jgi:hypothetical protein
MLYTFQSVSKGISDNDIFFKERACRMYKTSAFLMARFFVDVPVFCTQVNVLRSPRIFYYVRPSILN